MREYRFRGKATVTGEWVYGWYAKCFRPFHADADVIITKKGETIEVDPETVGQYTGVKERYPLPQMVGEGQEIYTGDIVRIFGGEYCQGYYQYNKVIVIENACDIWMLEESEYIQLLGNKWDNPKLLKEGSV